MPSNNDTIEDEAVYHAVIMAGSILFSLIGAILLFCAGAH